MSDFFVLMRLADASGPDWDLRRTVAGNREQVSAIVDLGKGVPYGWRLLRGKKARRFLKWTIKSEMRWLREESALKTMRGPN
jgi:hypothetical protein